MQYGIDYNARRKKLNIPIIPAKWQIKASDEHSTNWIYNKDTVGHIAKIVAFSNCTVTGELDTYMLKPLNGQQRLIEIEYLYSVDDGNFHYFYQIDHNRTSVSKQKIDSIFNAEAISNI